MQERDTIIETVEFNGAPREYVSFFDAKYLIQRIIGNNESSVDRINRRRKVNKEVGWDNATKKQVNDFVYKLADSPQYVIGEYKGREFLVLMNEYQYEIIIKALPTDISGVELQSYRIQDLGLTPKTKESTYLKDYGNIRDPARFDEERREIIWYSEENPLSEHDIYRYFVELENVKEGSTYKPHARYFIDHYVEQAKTMIDDFDEQQKTDIAKRAKVFSNLVANTYAMTKELDDHDRYHSENKAYNDMNDFYKLKYTETTSEARDMNAKLKETMKLINPLISKIPLACQNEIMYETVGIVLRYMGYKSIENINDLEFLTRMEKLIKPSLEVKA